MCVSIVTVNPIKFKIYIKYLKYILILYIIKVKYHIYLFSNIYHIVPIVKILKSKIKKTLPGIYICKQFHKCKHCAILTLKESIVLTKLGAWGSMGEGSR